MPTPITITGPFIGINQTTESREIDPKEARDALNCMLDQSAIDARLGFERELSAIGYAGPCGPLGL